jgi:hypothetical protein
MRPLSNSWRYLPSIATFDSVSYTLCPVGNTDWVMKAAKITLNSKANKGIAEILLKLVLKSNQSIKVIN